MHIEWQIFKTGVKIQHRVPNIFKWVPKLLIECQIPQNRHQYYYQVKKVSGLHNLVPGLHILVPSGTGVVCHLYSFIYIEIPIKRVNSWSTNLRKFVGQYSYPWIRDILSLGILLKYCLEPQKGYSQIEKVYREFE